MKPIEIKGVDKVIRNLRRTLPRKIGRGTENGFMVAAHMIMRESLKIVPVQTGNLKASWNIKKHGSGIRTIVEFGYFLGTEGGKTYAPYVHEIPSPSFAGKTTAKRRVTHGAEFNIKHAAEIERAKGTWRGSREGGMFYRKPEEQWKFLEKPIRDNQKKILSIIAREIRKVK